MSAHNAGLREAVERLASRLLNFDILNEQVPTHVDVPDDYEAGVNEAGRHLRALLAEHPATPAEEVARGLCWSRGGTIWPNEIEPRCELRAGHAGAHECDRGPIGGTAVWTDPEEPR